MGAAGEGIVDGSDVARFELEPFDHRAHRERRRAEMNGNVRGLRNQFAAAVDRPPPDDAREIVAMQSR